MWAAVGLAILSLALFFGGVSFFPPEGWFEGVIMVVCLVVGGLGMASSFKMGREAVRVRRQAATAAVTAPAPTSTSTTPSPAAGRGMAVAALVISLASATYGWLGVGGLEEEVAKKATSEDLAALTNIVVGKADDARVTAVVAWADTVVDRINYLVGSVAQAKGDAAEAKREAGAMASKIKNLARSTDARMGVLEGQAAQFAAGAQAVMEAGAGLEQRTAALERDVGNLYIARARQDSVLAANRRLFVEADSILTRMASLPSLRKALADYEKAEAKKRAEAAKAAARVDTAAVVPDTSATRAAK